MTYLPRMDTFIGIYIGKKNNKEGESEGEGGMFYHSISHILVSNMG